MQHDNGRGRLDPLNMEYLPGAFAETPQDEYEFPPIKDILAGLWRRLWLILLVAAVCGAAAVGYAFLQPPIYQASIQVLIGQEPVDRRGTTVNDIVGLQDFAKTAAEVLPTRTVAEAAIEQLDPQTLPEDYAPEDLYPEDILYGLSAEPTEETLVINVSYEDLDPEGARQIVNAVGAAFTEQIAEVRPDPSITAVVWEEAELPESPVSPDPWRDGFIALFMGGVLGVGLAFLLDRLADPWRSPEELERISGVPTFGVIREFAISEGKNLKETMAEERNGARDDREARMWEEKLAEVDSKRPRYQAMAAEGLISSEELRAKLAELEETREEAEREIARMWAEKLAKVESERTRLQDMAADGLISLEELRTKLAELEETREVVAKREMNGGS